MASHYISSKSQLANYISIRKKYSPTGNYSLNSMSSSCMTMLVRSTPGYMSDVGHKCRPFDPLNIHGPFILDKTPTWMAWHSSRWPMKSTGLRMFALFMTNDAWRDVGGSGLLSQQAKAVGEGLWLCRCWE